MIEKITKYKVGNKEYDTLETAQVAEFMALNRPRIDAIKKAIWENLLYSDIEIEDISDGVVMDLIDLFKAPWQEPKYQEDIKRYFIVDSNGSPLDGQVYYSMESAQAAADKGTESTDEQHWVREV